GTGSYLPERVITNADIARRGVDTTDEWIVQRTGIRERRQIAPGESTLTLATEAARAALADAGLAPEDVDLILCATITPEHLLPSTACLLQTALGCRWVPAFDLAAACSGFVWGVTVAATHILSGTARTVLVIGAEALTNITDPTERGTCILFGDAAGAAVLRRSEDPRRSVLAARWGADGARGKFIIVPAGGSHLPPTHETIAQRLHYMHMQGREVYKFAVTQMAAIIEQTCADAGVGVDELALVIPHQSNLRIIESACEKAQVPMAKVLVNIDRYGNTSAASVAVGLHEARQMRRIKSGDLVMLVAFGAGLTWGSILLRV
ncbi:MAG: beta-ketoacyl-ACP synthase III, partial [Planctomycetota bacterium]